jgi:rhodanese-related sulfurtransferase
MRDMTVREIKDYLAHAQPRPLLLDVREPWEYGICHLQDSRLIPMRTIPAFLQELDPAQELVVICHHGIRSRQVALFLEHQGFRKVINMQGGMAAWARDVDPGMPTY